jgi:hydroxypyruvate isomerase
MDKLRAFCLDFAPHIGFPTPSTPLFSELAESSASRDQIAFAARQGFKRIQDPFVMQRTAAEQAAIGDLAHALSIGLGCLVFAPMSEAMQPLWSAADPRAYSVLEAKVDAAIAVAQRIGSRHIAVLTGTDRNRSRADQMGAMAHNLACIADRAEAAGCILCVEAVSAQRLPQMLLHHYADAVDVVERAGHPAVRLIFDTAHVQAMDGDILGNLDRTWDRIEIIQLADHPGRVEPGAGELNFGRILDEIARRGFTGPVELEHLWSSEGPEPQQQYLQWLGRWR